MLKMLKRLWIGVVVSLLNSCSVLCVALCNYFAKFNSQLLLAILLLSPLPVIAATEKPVDDNLVLILFTGHEQIPFQQEVFQGFIEEQYSILFEHPEMLSKEIYIHRLDAYRSEEGYLKHNINSLYKNYGALPGTIIAEGNFAIRVAQGIINKQANDIELIAVNTSLGALSGFSKSELYDLETSFESIGDLFPGIEELIVLAPASRRLEVEDLWAFNFSDQFELTILDESLSFDETVKELAATPDNRVIFWVGRGAVSVTEDGLPIQLVKKILDLDVAPVISMLSSTLVAGGLGGYMIRSQELGQKIAQLAYDHSEGFKPPSKRFIFDYNELNKWEVDTSNVSGSVTIINEPVSIFTQTQMQHYILFALVLGTLLLSAFAWWVWHQLNVSNRQLSKIKSLDSQLHLALTTSKLALFEENVTHQTAQWIIEPPNESVAPFVGEARLNATEPKYRNQISDALAQVGVVVEYPLFIAALNRIKWVRNSTIAEHTNAQGELIRIQLSQDVTDIKEKELALAEAVNNLEAVLQKQKQMFAVIGHELRTPVSALNMMLEADDNAIPEQLGDIRSTSQHLLAVLDDLRTVVEPELIQEKKLSNTRPIEIIERSLTPLKAMLEKKQIHCSVKSNELAGHCFTIDQRGIRQVLTNLLKNAAVHGQGREIQIQVDVLTSVLSEQNAMHQLRISVEDDGRGIPSSQHESIFDPFERGETDADGTGLGLHICREIVQANGGTLKVKESEALGGACFTIEIPIEPMLTATTNEETSIVSLEGLSVLMAEDNLMLRKLSENLLQKLGANPVLVENGQLALDQFKEKNWDLIITDIFMPEMNGYELVEAIRSTGSNVKILGVTAATVGSEREMLLQAGADVVMGKPITSESLRNALLQLKLEV